MTKEEREKAIDLLDNLIGMIADNQNSDYDKALKMGIESLRKEPCEDAVSRQSVKDGMIKYGFHAPDMTVTEFVEDMLPSVMPTQRWVPVTEDAPPI